MIWLPIGQYRNPPLPLKPLLPLTTVAKSPEPVKPGEEAYNRLYRLGVRGDITERVVKEYIMGKPWRL